MWVDRDTEAEAKSFLYNPLAFWLGGSFHEWFQSPRPYTQPVNFNGFPLLRKVRGHTVYEYCNNAD